jgi:hypothetical protein
MRKISIPVRGKVSSHRPTRSAAREDTDVILHPGESPLDKTRPLRARIVQT